MLVQPVFLTISLTNGEWIALIGLVNALVGSFIAIYNSFIKGRFINKGIGKKTLTHFDKAEIKKSISYYVEPDSCSVDPANLDEMHELIVVREPMFKTLKRFLSAKNSNRYLMILADSGMGKTSLLLNFMFKEYKRWFKRNNIYFFPLSISGIDSELENIPNPSNKIVLFDALDEDIKAIKDGYDKRIKELTSKTRDFKKVIITCRSQFFSNESVIPKETPIVRIGPRSLGESGFLELGRLYLAPLSDKQVDKFIKARFSWFNTTQRERAKEVIARIPRLSIRPMILSHIGDFLEVYTSLNHLIDYYRVIISGWIERESRWYKKPQDLLDFSKKLSLDLIYERNRRGGEHIPIKELDAFAKSIGVDLSLWKISGKSLLNRNEFNFKFAHRSILEYLFVKAYLEAPMDQRKNVNWSDQMKVFLVEIISTENVKDLSMLDLRMIDFRGLRFEKTSFKKCNLSGSNFGGCSLEFVDFEDADCTGVSFDKAQIKLSVFRNTSLRQSTFIEASFNEVYFWKVDFGGSAFIRSKLSNVEFAQIREEHTYFGNSEVNKHGRIEDWMLFDNDSGVRASNLQIRRQYKDGSGHRIRYYESHEEQGPEENDIRPST